MSTSLILSLADFKYECIKLTGQHGLQELIIGAYTSRPADVSELSIKKSSAICGGGSSEATLDLIPGPSFALAIGVHRGF